LQRCNERKDDEARKSVSKITKGTKRVRGGNIEDRTELGFSGDNVPSNFPQEKT
jgi:hypothetical protein